MSEALVCKELFVAGLGRDVERHQAVESAPYGQGHGGAVQQPVGKAALQVDGDAVRLLRGAGTGRDGTGRAGRWTHGGGGKREILKTHLTNHLHFLDEILLIKLNEWVLSPSVLCCFILFLSLF